MPAFPFKRSTIGVLDNIRLKGGTGKLTDYFQDLATIDLQKAIALLNEHELNYASLYLLKQFITELGILTDISGRSRMAMELTDKILAKKRDGITAMIKSADGNSDNDGTTVTGTGTGTGAGSYRGTGTVTRTGSNHGTGRSINRRVGGVHSTLKWMFETGSADDGLENRYDEVMELTAILLIKSFKDNTVLEHIAQMIFERNRKGLLTNHLIWAFFEARNPRSLSLLADYLLTGNQSDANLAHKLLKFILGIPEMIECTGKDQNNCIDTSTDTSKSDINIDGTNIDSMNTTSISTDGTNIDSMNTTSIRTGNMTAYASAIHWIEENSAYLQYTGEGYHQTCNPIPYTICNNAKYLCSPVSFENGIAAEAFTPYETTLLEELKGLDPDTVALLASHSVMLNRHSSSRWRSWLHYPVIDRIRIARSAKGDFR